MRKEINKNDIIKLRTEYYIDQMNTKIIINGNKQSALIYAHMLVSLYKITNIKICYDNCEKQNDTINFYTMHSKLVQLANDFNVDVPKVKIYYDKKGEMCELENIHVLMDTFDSLKFAINKNICKQTKFAYKNNTQQILNTYDVIVKKIEKAYLTNLSEVIDFFNGNIPIYYFDDASVCNILNHIENQLLKHDIHISHSNESQHTNINNIPISNLFIRSITVEMLNDYYTVQLENEKTIIIVNIFDEYTMLLFVVKNIRNAKCEYIINILADKPENMSDNLLQNELKYIVRSN